MESAPGLDRRVAHLTTPWLNGSQSAALTLAHAALAVGDAASTVAALRRLSAAEPRLAALAEQAAARAHGLDRVCRLLASVDHDAAQDPAAIGAMFDRAVAMDEICSVAIYALGDASLLAAATDEVVDALAGEGVLQQTTRVLEIGCGTGRFAAALAPRVAAYHGIDVSAGMVEAARQRTASLENVRIDRCNGHDFAFVASTSVDVVLAIDVAPYWHQSGDAVVTAMLAESRRVLMQGGELIVLGWSYHGDDAAMRADARTHTARHGFAEIEPPLPHLRSWDAPAFRFRAT
jgi:SAM-dependent methyltransferase